MNRLIRDIVLVACCVFLFSCDGEEKSATETQPEATESKASNNPLANQQQAIKDAQSIQGILDKDTEEKKKALDSAN